MAVTLKERRRAGFRALWLSVIVFAALVAAVIVYELPDWASLLVFVVAFGRHAGILQNGVAGPAVDAVAIGPDNARRPGRSSRHHRSTP